jgi:hypothetical protein
MSPDGFARVYSKDGSRAGNDLGNVDPLQTLAYEALPTKALPQRSSDGFDIEFSPGELVRHWYKEWA